MQQKGNFKERLTNGKEVKVMTSIALNGGTETYCGNERGLVTQCLPASFSWYSRNPTRRKRGREGRGRNTA
jgi:hypothetical protein